MSVFSDLFNPTQKYDQAARDVQTGIDVATKQAVPIYQQGQQTLTDYYGNAINTLQPVLGGAAGGADLYKDLTGANGPIGQQRAASLFQSDPGRQYDLQAMQEALTGVERKYGTGGGQNSGGLINAIMDRENMLANQSYGNWAQRLQPYLGQQTDLSKALASVYGTAGGDITSQDNALANLLYGSTTGQYNAAAAALMGAQNAENKVGGQVLDFGSKLLGYALGGKLPTGGFPSGGGGTGFGAYSFGGQAVPVAT